MLWVNFSLKNLSWRSEIAKKSNIYFEQYTAYTSNGNMNIKVSCDDLYSKSPFGVSRLKLLSRLKAAVLMQSEE